MSERPFRIENESFFRRKGLRPVAFVIGLALFGASCGLPGGVPVSNETVPASATYLTSGSFVGTGDVSGVAQVYLSGSEVLLHLDGLSAPTGTAYSVFLENGNSSIPFYSSTLKTPSGNQNYYTGLGSPTIHFSRVVIRANASTTSTTIASAILSTY